VFNDKLKKRKLFLADLNLPTHNAVFEIECQEEDVW
jgi:hypothetical protein